MSLAVAAAAVVAVAVGCPVPIIKHTTYFLNKLKTYKIQCEIHTCLITHMLVK